MHIIDPIPWVVTKSVAGVDLVCGSECVGGGGDDTVCTAVLYTPIPSPRTECPDPGIRAVLRTAPDPSRAAWRRRSGSVSVHPRSPSTDTLWFHGNKVECRRLKVVSDKWWKCLTFQKLRAVYVVVSWPRRTGILLKYIQIIYLLNELLQCRCDMGGWGPGI